MKRSIKIYLVTLICLVSVVLPMDYGVYGVFLIIVFRYLNGWRMAVGHVILNSVFILINGFDYWIQLFSVVGTLLIAGLPVLKSYIQPF